MKEITFILPGQGTKPSGGFKIVYEYASYLAACDWRVEILHLAWLPVISSLLKGIVKYIVFMFTYKPNKWITLHKTVKTRWLFRLRNIHTKKIVVTAWSTAAVMQRMKNNGKFDIYYFIQDDESKFDEVVNNNLQDIVINTWRERWKMIVINPFLHELVSRYNQAPCYIPNGIDFSRFRITNEIIKRNRYNVCMLAHERAYKGTETGVEAFKRLKARYPELAVTLFSVYRKMDYIPDWMVYERLPSGERIAEMYNEAAIFVSCSYTEGFGLPLAEALACGCAAVVSDIPAYRWMGNNENLLYFNAGDVDELCVRITYLLEHDNTRCELAVKAHAHIKETLSFEASAKKLEDYLSR